MVSVDVHGDIANNQDGVLLSMLGLENAVFSVDTVKKIFNDNPKETDFKFNIHCNGGSVSEGLAIYDILRTSGKNIYTHVEGGCHSMAVVLLLSAPLENRTANINARALLHRVYAMPSEPLNAEQMQSVLNTVKAEEDNIINIYADRTGRNKAALRALMNAEKERTADELLAHGFISKIINYNTNQKSKTMAKDEKKPIISSKQKTANLLNSIGKALGLIVNYDYKDNEGNILFSTESEEDTLATGDTVTLPDGATEGTFTLPDGRVVTIVDSVVTEIAEAPSDNDKDQQIAQLQAENASLKELLNQSKDVITELQNNAGSHYTPAGRTVAPKTNKVAPKSVADYKADARERANKKRGE